jgi:hypothetical protein
MSFDLFFVAAETEEEAAQVLRHKDFDHAATPQEELRMHRVVTRLLQISPEATVNASHFPHSLWIGNGNFPDFDVYPTYIFCSFRPKANEQWVGRIRGLLAIFEDLGYIGFDPQSGNFVDSRTYSLGAPPPAAAAGPETPPRKWWHLWRRRAAP